MRTASLLGLALSVGALLIAACADSEPAAVGPDETSETDPSEPSTIPDKDGGKTTTQADASSTKKCAPSCTTDEDCSNSCPAVPSAVSCCDTQTSTCYSSKTAACPAPPPDGGEDPPSY